MKIRPRHILLVFLVFGGFTAVHYHDCGSTDQASSVSPGPGSRADVASGSGLEAAPPVVIDGADTGVGFVDGIAPATAEAKAAALHATLARDGSKRLAILGADHRVRRCIAIWGQSNAAGRKFIEQVSAPQHDILVGNFASVPLSEWESSFTNPFQVLYDTETGAGSQTPVRADGPLAPRPYTLIPNAVPNMGAELSLGHGIDVYAPNQWGIIKCAVGGTTLNTEWCPSCNYPTGPPNLFNKCVAQTQAAAHSLGCHVAALVWIQGESDACNSTLANAYGGELTTLFTAVRSTWPKLPIVLNRLSSAYTGCGDASTLATIRAAQLAWVAGTTKAAWVDSDGLLLDSGIHFVPDAYVTLGYRFPPALLNAMGYAIPPTASFSAFAQTRAATFTDTSVDPNVGSQASPAIGGSVTSWSWDFGDGATSTSQNPSHTYAADGAYTVKLLVRNGAGVPARTSQTITVATPTWTRDATSGVGFPSTSAEWSAFVTAHSLSAFGTPANGYTYQQASGTVADFLGAKTLSVAGAPTYQKTITGWSRKAIGGSGIAASQNANATTYTNVNATSWIAIAYIRADQSAGSNRPIFSLAGSGVDELETNGTNTSMRFRTGGVGTNGTLVHFPTAVHPYVILVDKTNQRNCIFSDIERICPAWQNPSGTSMVTNFSTTSDATVADVLGVVRWEGSVAERTDIEICHILRALGWNPTGYSC